MSTQSILIKKLHEQGKVNPIAYLVELAKNNTMLEIAIQFDVTYGLVKSFFSTNGIPYLDARSKINKQIAKNSDIYKKLSKTPEKDIAAAHGVSVGTIYKYMRSAGILTKKQKEMEEKKAQEKEREMAQKKKAQDAKKSAEEERAKQKQLSADFGCPFFICDDCKNPKALAVMSTKKDVCQRCLKNQIRGRV